MKEYTCPKEQFLRDVSEHVLTVLRDDGADRHLRFRKPGTGCYGFDLLTWPGHLLITGDCGSYPRCRGFVHDQLSPDRRAASKRR
jgi:hypothetical protein